MSTEGIVLVVDGGGTSTTACLAGRSRDTASVLGRSQGDQSNPAVVGFDQCLQNVIETSRLAIANSSLEESDRISRIAVGLAGIEATNFRSRLEQTIATQLDCDDVSVMTDIELLLLASSGERATIGVISGTGSVAVGRTRTGKSARSGGRGFLTGDAGSGFWIGQQGITAAIRALDHIGAETALVDLIGDLIGSRDPAKWTHFVYSDDRDPRTAVASCAPIVFSAADHGDAVAVEIIERAATELAHLVQAVASQLALADRSYDVVLAGSVLIHQPMARNSLLKNLSTAKLAPVEETLVPDPSQVIAMRLAE